MSRGTKNAESLNWSAMFIDEVEFVLYYVEFRFGRVSSEANVTRRMMISLSRNILSLVT